MSSSSNPCALFIKKTLHNPAILKLLEEALEKKTLPHLSPQAFSFFISILYHHANPGETRRIWIHLPLPLQRNRLFLELATWNTPCAVLPKAQHAGIDAPQAHAQRLQTLSTIWQTNHPLLFDKESFEEKLPSPQSFNKEKLALRLTQEISPLTLEKQLLAAGYEKTMQVEARGHMARRGGIFDIFSWQAQSPVRLEFFDTQIDSIRLFDIDSQRSTREINACSILLCQPEEDVILRSFFKENDLLIDGEIYLNTPQISSESFGLALPFGRFETKDFLLNASLQKMVFDQINTWLDESFFIGIVFVSSGEKKRFEEIAPPAFFKKKNLHALTGSLLEGFFIPHAKIAILSASVLFGRPQHTRPTAETIGRPKMIGSSLSQLKEGDYIVHLDYGIGRFEAFSHNEDNQEVLSVAYANDLIIEIPISHAHLLTRFVGLGGKAPTLSRISTNRWKKTKETVANEVMEYAQHLLQTEALRKEHTAYAHPPDDHWVEEFEESFVHQLTEGQRQAIADVKADMEAPRPMDRLLCGDVGFGKTEVALRAAFKAVCGGKQVALLAPTTVLAAQHFQTFSQRMSDYPFRLALLNRFRSTKEVKKTLEELAAGQVDIIIGTHRLLSKDVVFNDLGLAIIDEEQRFGVSDKERFKELFASIDVLTLSATPIPRTLYLALMGTRSMSTIDTPIPGKVPIHTHIAHYDERQIGFFIERELQRGGQVFYLHNRVASLPIIASFLQKIVPSARIAIAHGQMEKNALESVMEHFMLGKSDILLSTSIIESGIDIPRANTIIIDRADCFGLADLYQLRGRVGRAGGDAYALLIVPSGSIAGDAGKRIAAIKSYTALGSGFKIAMRDLEIRGAGHLLGKKQSGHIATVGFELYCSLLEDSITRLKNHTVYPKTSTCILKADFLDTHALPIGLPEDFIEDKKLRIAAFKDLSMANNHKALAELKNHWKDYFGKLPQEAHHLLELQTLRILGKQANISHISFEKNRLLLTRNHSLIQINGRSPRLVSKQPLAKIKEAIALLKKL